MTLHGKFQNHQSDYISSWVGYWCLWHIYLKVRGNSLWDISLKTTNVNLMAYLYKYWGITTVYISEDHEYLYWV